MGAERLTGFAFHRHVPRNASGTAPASSVGHSLSRFVSTIVEDEANDLSPGPFRRVATRTKTIPSLVGSGGFGVGFAIVHPTRKRATFGAGGFGFGFTTLVRQIKKSGSGGFGIGGGAGPFLRTIANLSQGGFGVGGGAGAFGRTVVFPTKGFGIGYGDVSVARGRTVAPGSGGFGAGYGNVSVTRLSSRIGSGGFGVGFTDIRTIRNKVIVVGSYDGGLPVSSQAGAKIGFGIGGAATGIQRTQNGITTGTTGRQRSNRGPVTQREMLNAVKREALLAINERYFYIATDPTKINPNPPAETFVVLTLFGGLQDQQELTGGGRTSDVTVDQLEFRVYSRLSVDQHRRQTDWTLDVQRGSSERARTLRNSLHMIDVMDESGFLMLAQPLRALGLGQPQLGTPAKEVPGWGYIPVRFEAVYTVYLGE